MDRAPVWRIRDRASFDALRRHGCRARHGPVSVTWLAAGPGDPPRVAYAVGRRAGNAVARNRLRRRLRSVITDLAPTLPPGTYLVGAGADATRLSHDELRTSVSTAVAGLRRPPPGRAP